MLKFCTQSTLLIGPTQNYTSAICYPYECLSFYFKYSLYRSLIRVALRNTSMLGLFPLRLWVRRLVMSCELTTLLIGNEAV